MFTKENIAQVKANKGSIIRDNTNISPENVYHAFFILNEETKSMGVEHCCSPMYAVSVGDFNSGVKYNHNGENYYLFYGANTSYAPPQTMAIGKAKEGLVYLIWEITDVGPDSFIKFRIIPEKYINRNESGFRPKSYENYIDPSLNRIDEAVSKLTDRDVECVEMAFDAIAVFSNLIESILAKNKDTSHQFAKKNTTP
jgi:hypothetical protein